MAVQPDLLSDQDRWLARVPEATRDFVRSRARICRFADGAAVYVLGDPPDGLYKIVAGEVRLVSYPAIGRQVITLAARHGHWFGELSVVDGGPRPHDAVCRGPVTLIHLSMHDIVAYAGVNPAIYGEVALIGCQHQRAALSFIETMLAKPTKARLAEMILDMAAPEPGQPAGNLVLPISQEDLAGRIGISRQHLNSLLSDLKRSGGISTSYGRIHVHDSRALLAAAR